MKQLFNNQWFFCEKKIHNSFDIKGKDVENIEYKHIDIPHDWLIYDTNNLYRDSEGWYKKKFNLSKLDSNKQIILEFDGIYMDSEIYINEEKVFEWKYGYTPQIINITKFIQTGENYIFIRVKHEHPNSRWYSGAGIYRNIWIHKLENLFIAPNDLYINTKLSNFQNNEWKININLNLTNFINYKGKITINNCLKTNKKIIYLKDIVLDVENKKQNNFDYNLLIENPKLWSPENPNLYKLITTLKFSDKEQIIESNIGFKNIEFRTKEGLFLNNKHIKIKGVCQHHDLGALGSAENRVAIKRQLEILKKMGVNAIRTAHNPFSKTFLELTDEMGFLVQSEFTDIWKHSKTKFDYARFFDKWHEKDIEAWIKHDRNHPSVFMWSIGNEIYDTHGRKDGIETTKKIISLIKKYDPLKNSTITFGSNYLLWENTQKAADIFKIVGYNYGEKLYDEHHEKYPDWIIYGSETCSVTQSRGVYHFPLEESILSDDDFQCSSLGNSSTSWGAKSVEECILGDLNNKFSLGQFLWTGFDYIGEPTPYNTKNSYFGQIDTAGFPKDSFYIIQSAWTSYKKNPMIHIFPYWDFSEGQLINVRICSNAPKIELKFNNKSLGNFENNINKRKKVIHDFKIKYQYGKLEAFAYDEFDNIIAKDIVQSFENVENLVLKSNKKNIKANGTDLAFIEVNSYDKNGIFVANANNRIHVEVEGAGRLIGIDNGDSTDFDQYKENSKRLFNGKLLLIVASTFKSGEIKITVKSKTLKPQALILNSIPEKINIGTTDALQKNSNSLIKPELPIRKINIKKNSNNEKENIEFLAEIYPENSDSKNIEWRITDKKGIDTEICSLKVDNLTAVVKPLSDGIAYIRCGTKNGKNHLDFYSTLDLKFEGYGTLNLNPFKPISGGHYSRSNVELTNGNERGIATLRNTESWVIFDDIDFGNEGSNNITLSLFPLEGNIFDIEIWEGTPRGKNSKLKDIVKYTKGTIWNTYQKQNFKLKEKFKGIKTISFVFNQKVHIKEFFFEKEVKSFNKINVIENDLIYGDSFKIKKNSIEHIGNNVTLKFNNFDFGSKGTDKIRIEGQSPQTPNSIHLRIKSNKTKEELFLLDFKKTKDYCTKEFNLNSTIKGKVNIEFLFLPGSNFNFKNFKFIKVK